MKTLESRMNLVEKKRRFAMYKIAFNAPFIRLFECGSQFDSVNISTKLSRNDNTASKALTLSLPQMIEWF